MKMPSERLGRIGWWALLTVAAVLTLTLVVDWASGAHDGDEVAEVLGRYTKTFAAPGDKTADPNDGDDEPENAKKPGDAKKADPRDEQVKRIAKRNLFSPPAKNKDKGLTAKLTGLLGEAAYFDGKPKPHKVGDSYDGATVKEIGPNWAEVEIKADGKTQTKKLYVWSKESSPSSPGGPPMRGKQPSARQGGGPGPSRPSPPSASKMPPGFKLPPEAIEQFKKMSPEKQAEALKHAPPEIVEQLKGAL